jgi:hypothetical protein
MGNNSEEVINSPLVDLSDSIPLGTSRYQTYPSRIPSIAIDRLYELG